MRTEKEYLHEMETDKEAYKISIADFTDWLEDNHLEDKFLKAIKTESIWFVASDYSIPVIMVKYFQRAA